MKKLLWVLSALLLSGCVAAPYDKYRTPKPPTAKEAVRAAEPQYRTMEIMGVHDLRYPTASFFFPHGTPILGLHSRFGTHSRLKIDDTLEADWARAKVVSAHEMGHAFGIDHISDIDCWMYPSCPTTRNPQPIVPCTQELNAAKRLTEGKVWKLKIVKNGFPVIERAAVAAAQAWNHALGRQVIIVE